ncbi:acylphosphatase [Spirochaetota bacterium]|nr:acylphosphatase [Spirochaetota bacterium]
MNSSEKTYIKKYLSHGRVQGVGYRQFVHSTARKLALCGTVRNLPTGTVETLAYGPQSALNELLQALKKGPPAAEVSTVTITSDKQTTEKNWNDFTILY